MDALTAIGGLFTILASGVTSTIVTYRLNRSKDQFVFMREKAEALYLAADEYGKMLGGYTLNFLAVAESRLDWNQMQDLQNAHMAKERKHGGAEMMTMLVELYYPTLKPKLDALAEARKDFNKSTFEAKRAYRANGSLEPKQWMPVIMAKGDAIDRAVREFEQGIIAAAHAQLQSARRKAVAV